MLPSAFCLSPRAAPRPYLKSDEPARTAGYRRCYPPDYTFTTGNGGDNGVHTFPGGVTLVTVGNQTLTVTDTVRGISGSATITVGPGP